MSKHKSKDSSKVGTGSAKSAKMIAPVVTAAVTRKARCPPVFVEMREEIGDVHLVSEFTNTPLLVTPTNEALFPWGSKIARLYTTRKWHRLMLSYVPNTATSIGGSVMAAMNADPDKPPFDDDDELLNHQGAINGAPYTGWTMNLLQKSNKVPVPEKFNNTQENLLGGDILEDLHTVADGVLNFAVKGLQSFFGAGVTVQKTDAGVRDVKAADPPTEVVTGKLYIDYKVEYNDPVLENVDGGLAHWKQEDGSGRPLVYPEPMFTAATIAAPFMNDIGVQIRSKATPPTGVDQLVGFKFASRGLYALFWDSHAVSAVSAADMIAPDQTQCITSDFVELNEASDFGAVAGTSAAMLFTGGTARFITFNVTDLATEDTSAIQVDDLWCDLVLQLTCFDPDFDSYVQQYAHLYVMKLGQVSLEISAKHRARKGGLQNRHISRQLEWFERRQIIKTVRMREMQKSISAFSQRAKKRECKVAALAAPTGALVKAPVVAPAAAGQPAAVGATARLDGEAKAGTTSRAGEGLNPAAAAAKGATDTKTALIDKSQLFDDPELMRRNSRCGVHVSGAFSAGCNDCVRRLADLLTEKVSDRLRKGAQADDFVVVDGSRDKTANSK